jgi:hypothetical protein
MNASGQKYENDHHLSYGPPLRRVLCSFLFGAAALCVVPTNIQAEKVTINNPNAIQAAGSLSTAPGDIVWVTTGFSIGKYSTDGTTAIPNFITEPSAILGPTGYGRQQGEYAGYLGAILVSGPTLYVDTAEGVTFAYLYTLLYHPIPVTYVNATYNAERGNVMNFPFFAWPIYPFTKIVPRGMALSGSNLYVATVQGQVGSISKIAATGGGNTYFIPSGPEAPYALAVNGNVLYVTNNAQNSNGNFYISTYTDTGATGVLNKANFIEIQTGGLYGLALLGNTLYVSVFNGSAPGVYTYNATTGAPIQQGPFVSVNEPWGIAIEGNTLYVASHQDSAIYEFDATKGGPPTGSIKLSGAPTNITVEPAAALGN